MRPVRALWLRLAGLLHKEGQDREFAAELDSHLALHIEDNLRRGMTPSEARRQALVSLGGIESAREAHRDRRGVPFLETFLQDVRFGLRMLRKNPGFTIVAILTLAIGIGANTAIFSVVNTVLLAPLPFRDPDRLVMLWGRNLQKGLDGLPVSPGLFSAWKASNHVFEGMAASTDDLNTLTGGGEPEMVIGYDFSADYLPLLGSHPSLGRTFLPEEDRPGGPNVALLSDRIWRRRFSADPGIVGKTIQLGSAPYTVIGVMPTSFRWPDLVEIWTPLAMPSSALNDWKNRYLRVVARLKPGVTIEQAQAEMNALAERFAREHPDTNTGEGVKVESVREEIAGDIQRPLVVLLGAVGLVLLIACVNVAGLMLARTAARGREIAVRIALGAGRCRLIRQMITESALLALAGGAAGLALAYAGSGMLLRLFPKNIANLSIPTVETIPVDGRVLAFTLAATLLTGLFFGLAPAFVSLRGGVDQALKESGRSRTASTGERRFRTLLVVGEISLAFVLLIGAGLLIRGFERLIGGDIGFRAEKVLALEAFPSPAQYPGKEPEKLRGYLDRSIENLRAIPGVQTVGATNFLPLTGFWGPVEFAIEGRPAPEKGHEPTADNRVVSPDYFRSMGIPLVRGRAFTASDGPDAPRVAVVSTSLAERYWKGEDPIGRRIQVGDSVKPDSCEIVGVAGNVHSRGLEEKLHDDVYRPFAQVYFPLVAFTVKTSGDPSQITAAAKAAIWKENPTQPFYKIITMETLVAESTALRRISTVLLAAFSAIAMALAAVGIYGVLSYSVAQRTREIGIRAALGAQSGSVFRMILGEGARIAIAGVGFGLAGALAFSRLLGSLLYEVGAWDPFTFVGVAALSASVALAACYLPARRATRLDPLDALRCE
jgi:putative ABC transport system permease protein